LIYLDCESVRSTYESISNIFSLEKGSIKRFLHKTDLEEYFLQHDPLDTANRVLFELFEKEFSVLPKILDYVCWFHLTRTMKNNKFENGLLPLNKILDFIWETLFKIFRDTSHIERLERLRLEGVNDRLYQLKTSYEYLGGPFGLLIKEIAFRELRIGNQFLDCPEIIEDICNGYEKKYNESIINIAKKALIPCIVKFKSSARLGNDCTSAALYYLYKIDHKEELSIDCNTCFDGGGYLVPAKDIIKIEFL